MTRKVKSVDYQTQEEKRRTLYFEENICIHAFPSPSPPPFLDFTPVKDMTMYLATTFGRAVDKLTKYLNTKWRSYRCGKIIKMRYDQYTE